MNWLEIRSERQSKVSKACTHTDFDPNCPLCEQWCDDMARIDEQIAEEYRAHERELARRQ